MPLGQKTGIIEKEKYRGVLVGVGEIRLIEDCIKYLVQVIDVQFIRLY